MKLKSYFASTVEAAMSLARQELGPEAMLVNSQRTSAENRQYGEYEVVFAMMPQGKPEAPEPDRDAESSQSVCGDTEAVRRLQAEISGLRQTLDRMAASFARARASSSFRGASRGAAALLATLLDADLDEDTAESVALRAAHFPSPELALPQVLSEMMQFHPTIGRAGKQRRVVALVGPPGGGKTTTLVKLAARYGIAQRRPTQIISTDCIRFAAADQLRSYASILGVGFQAVETPHALEMALEEHRQKELVFIDTPGLSEREMEEAAGLPEVISQHPEIDVHLVAPASMRLRDLARAAERYSVFRPGKILFTKVDETESPGAVVSQAVRSRLPISFFGTGQQVPEDLEPAGLDWVCGLLTRGGMPAGLAAAANL